MHRERLVEAGSPEPTIDAASTPAGLELVSLVFVMPGAVESFTLREGESVLVGRAEPARVILQNPTISRQHARFSVHQGRLFVEDAGSHNGVQVNGVPTKDAQVSSRDSVRIGDVEVLVLGSRSLPVADLRELSSLRFMARLGEELDRTRHNSRPIWLAALRWPERGPSPDELGRASQGLRSIDRFCSHAPHIVLVCLAECDLSKARELVNGLRTSIGKPSVAAFVSSPPHGFSAEALVAAAVNLVQGEHGGETRISEGVWNEQVEQVRVIGEATRPLFALAERTRHADLPVLVLGETGAGKEVIARAFHGSSRRAEGPFCEVNCAAIPGTLVESILFGYEKGAFTGADKRSAGLFEQAHQGSLFLDEIGELSLGAQSALLRALEAKRIRRLGASQEIEVDVRLIAATNRNLRELVSQGAFREDLLYRLEALTVRVPPLRERRDEVAPLATLFLRNAATKWAAPARELSDVALSALESYSWPGNIRQLRNAIERAVAVCANERVELDDLPEHVVEAGADFLRRRTPGAGESAASEVPLPDQLRAFEEVRIREALVRAGGNRSQAARLLGLPRRTLGSKLRDYGIE